jgi:hypothetical protein
MNVVGDVVAAIKAKHKKEKELAKQKQQQIAAEKKALEEQTKRKEAERIKRLLEAVDFEYTEDVERRAMHMLAVAAKTYDPSSPGAPSMRGFDGATMDIPTFKYVLCIIYL